MFVTPPARIGDQLQDVDTPALVIDLEAMEQNIRRMQSTVVERGVRLRPHSKTHKCAVIAKLQMDYGAVGVCAQKVAEAEALVRAGISNVLVSNQVIGDRKLQRLAALAREAKIGVCVDDAGNVGRMSEQAVRFGAQIDVLVEIEVGSERCGVPPGEPAVDLAQQVAAAPGLRFAGLQAYHGGAQHLRRIEERREAIAKAVAGTGDTISRLQAVGLDCETVAGAGTGTYEFERDSQVYNELQVGSYVFMDADYARNLDASSQPVSEFRHSLFVYASVISRTGDQRAVVDAGLKAFSFDAGMPIVADYEGLSYAQPSDEHGRIQSEDGSQLPVLGDKLRLIPGHCDPTVNLYDWYVCIRQNRVAALWPIVARGALT